MLSLPATMRAFVLTGHGGLDKLVLRDDWPVPAPGPGEVLIRIGACGLNNTDINTRTGWYSAAVTSGTGEGGSGGFAEARTETASWGGTALAFPRIQGADVAGRIAAVGEGVQTQRIGERVMVDPWLLDPADPADKDKALFFGGDTNGGYAEYALAPAANAIPVESPLSDAELATFATSSITAFHMLHRADARAGETVLIPGASGGVGSALVQVARMRGAVPIALCSADKAEAVKAIGAEVVLPRDPGNLREALRAAIGCETVDVVADVVGGPLWPQAIGALRRGGRYTCAGAIAGPVVPFDLRVFYLNDLTLTGATIVPAGMFRELVRAIERGAIKPLLAAAFPLERLREAQAMFLAKKHVGNIVVTMGAGPGA
jgi:NADPH:quinone reductase-like Zn-dependent oxidoreductase